MFVKQLLCYYYYSCFPFINCKNLFIAPTHKNSGFATAGIQCLPSVFERAWYKYAIWVCKRNAQTWNKNQYRFVLSSWYTLLYVGHSTAIPCKYVNCSSVVLRLVWIIHKYLRVYVVANFKISSHLLSSCSSFWQCE